jgi:chemosensory pili system protein ChpA (sensor histidine kinase/response regulator)
MVTSALAPFFDEMRKELAQTVPDLDRWIGAVATAAPDDMQAVDALESYAAQLERVGQTAEMIGLIGLANWCGTLGGMLPGVLSLAGELRQQTGTHLLAWPALLDRYLQDPADFEVSLALVEYLAHPGLLPTLDESASAKLLEGLTTLPVVPAELLGALEQENALITVSAEDVSLQLPEGADRTVFDTFIDEAPQNLEQFAALTAKIANGQADSDDMRNAKRIAHSFKGSANIVGIRGIAMLGHRTEDVLEYFEQNPIKPPRALGRSLVAASDCLAQMVSFLRGDEEAPAQALDVLNDIVAWANKVKSGDIASMQEDAEVEAPPVVSPALLQSAVPATENAETQPTLRIPVAIIEEMYRLIGEMTSKIARLETQVSNAHAHAQAVLAHNDRVQQQVVAIEKQVVLRGLSINQVVAVEGAFDPLELDRYNELHDATRALVEVSADARAVADNLGAGLASLRTEVMQQGQVNKDLQHQITSTRLAPVNSLMARLTRNVRQTCAQTGKQAELLIAGGEIRVDGDVLNKLADPLLHLLRNAVDHGIELPEERIAAGKSPQGTIHLIFVRQGSGIVVTIRDDGKGLDYVRIRAKAIERQLIAPEQPMTDAELARLVLLPGFSTRDQVSEISGRGVGLDVVTTRMAAIKGTVELLSETGQGCEFTLRFQASLVTQHILLVKAAQQLFAVPIHYIREAVPPNLGTCAQDASSAWYFELREERFPLHDLIPLTGYPAVPLDATRCMQLPKLLIVTPDGIRAMLVDSILESRSVMVKTLGKYLPQVQGVSGVTILGDGALVPLLNVPQLLAKPVVQSAAVASMAASARLQVRRILVVDDSLSVRKALIQLLQDQAFEVKGAGDGMEAVRMIDSFAPHLICTDLEMPNMNGLEFTRHVRLNPTWRHLPIIMITSRSLDKHREQALQAGVDFYLTKPYTDADLLKYVRQALQLERHAGQVMDANS